MNLAAAYDAWLVLLGFVGFVAACCWAADHTGRIIDGLAERHRHRRDLRRWHASCAVDDHAVLAEATAIVRQAERGPR